MIPAALLPYTAAIRIGAFVLAIGAMIGVGFWLGRKWSQAEVARLELSIANERAAASEAQRKASESARREEASRAEAVHYIATAYENGKTDAQAKADAVVADLRADNLRLREHWRGGVPATAGAPGRADAAQQHRAESAARIVRAAAECDAQVKGLQAVIEADRRKP